ncbi:hypothetical protein FIBSPDRAFT_891868 [Athelia psychrophila]|uniref:Uncharacterized protein n=1 Tax=Athelia psychrophila TaxID=1759441 RepID=A0A166J6K3_9AGAM|nr:hypothetical protein FIBSPDRAFT_891868 [Fibularhizoctonia sp. CBS 109695]
MPLKLQHINADTTWLLSIPIPRPSPTPANTTPDHFNILIDPWLAGTQTDHHHLFSRSLPPLHLGKSTSFSFATISQTTTMRTLPAAEKCTPVFAQGKAGGRDKSLRELVVEAGMKNANTMPEDMCIACLPTDNWWGMAGTRLHGVTIITFGLPSDLHESCVDVLALIHGTDEIDMPWWLAGPINLGPRSAPPLRTLLRPRVWGRQRMTSRRLHRALWCASFEGGSGERGGLEDILKAGASHAGGKVVDVTVLGSGEGILLGR